MENTITNTDEINTENDSNSLQKTELKIGALSSLRNKILKEEDLWSFFVLFFGIFSGFLTMICFKFIDNFNIKNNGNNGDGLSLLFIGFLFGFVSLSYFYFFSYRKLTLIASFFWLVANSLSFYLSSNFVAYNISNVLNDAILFALFMIIAGFIGVLTLIPIFKYFFCNINWKNIRTILFVGLVSPVSVFVLGISGVFFVWQTAVLVTFGYFIHKQNLRITAGE